MTMTYSILPSEIDFQDYHFDFEEYVRNEVGLDITFTGKKNGGKYTLREMQELAEQDGEIPSVRATRICRMNSIKDSASPATVELFYQTTLCACVGLTMGIGSNLFSKIVAFWALRMIYNNVPELP